MRNIKIMYGLVLLCLAGTSHSLHGQTKIIFDGNGVVRSQTQVEKNSRKVEFQLTEPLSDFQYILVYEFLNEPNYSNVQLNGLYSKLFNKDIINLEFKTDQKYLRYQLLRISKELFEETKDEKVDNENKETTKFADLIKILNQKVKDLKQERNNKFITELGKVTLGQFETKITELNSFLGAKAEKEALERKLASFLDTKDSLTRERLIDYNNELEKNRALKLRIQQYNTLLENAVESKVDVSKELINELRFANTDYLSSLDQLARFRAEKRNFRTEKAFEFNKQIAIHNSAIQTALKDPLTSLLNDFITTVNYRQEFLYGGQLIRDKQIQWASYDAFVANNAVTGFGRISGPLPVLDELEYLGINLRNVPLQAIKQQPDFKIEFVTEKATEVIDRFGGVRTVMSNDQINELFSLKLDEMKIDKRHHMFSTWAGTEKENVKCDAFLTYPINFFLGDGRVPEDCRSIIDKSLKSFNDFKEKIVNYPKDKIDDTYNKTLVDYNIVHGARFTQKDIPTIKISGKAPSKDVAAPVYVSDKMEQVAKRYWFGVSTALVYSSVPSYRYDLITDPNTQQQQVNETRYADRKITPALFISGYICGQRLDKRPECKSVSFNVGADFNKPLENLYVGIGIEPIRHLQLTLGAKFSQVKRVDSNLYSPYQVNYEPYLKEQWERGYFVSANLYLNVIPGIIKAVFTKN